MLGFLVAQNWEGAEASRPRALRSSRSGIARGGVVWHTHKHHVCLDRMGGVNGKGGSLSDVAVSEAYD
jgi:hypothetical protein